MGIWRFLHAFIGLVVAVFVLPISVLAAEYRPLPPSPPTSLSSDWLLHDAARNRLILYLPGYHQPAHAYYQWVRIQRNKPFALTFVAEPGLSIFLDNELVFNAPSSGTFSIDLASILPAHLSSGNHLLGVWQPTGTPALASFTAGSIPASSATTAIPAVAATRAQVRLPSQYGQNIFLVSLLLLGLLYGGVRTTYQPGMARIFQVEELFGNATAQQNFLAKPAFSLLNLLLILLFSFSFALILTALHTDLQNLPLFRRFLYVPETAVVAKIALYTLVIVLYVLGKYVYLEIFGYIFDIQRLVNVQYREFLRTTLMAGTILPLVLLLYLSLNPTQPRPVAWAANIAIGLLLVATVIRVARTLHRQASLFNLHLFAYLCATEVLPLLVILRLVVFS